MQKLKGNEGKNVFIEDEQSTTLIIESKRQIIQMISCTMIK